MWMRDCLLGLEAKVGPCYLVCIERKAELKHNLLLYVSGDGCVLALRFVSVCSQPLFKDVTRFSTASTEV